MNWQTAYVFTWVSTALAVSVGIIVTGRLLPLFALFIPAMISWSEDKK